MRTASPADAIPPITIPALSTPIDGYSSTLISPYVAGSGVLLVDNATALGSPSADAPVRLTAVRASDLSRLRLECTAVSGQQLTVVVADGYTDIPLAIGDVVECRPTAATILDIHAFLTDTATAANAVIAAANDGSFVGPAGATGATGETGPAGADSTVPGPTGPKGDKGDTGNVGATGSAGATGATGTAGADGPPGVVAATAPLAYDAGTKTVSLDASGTASSTTFLRGDSTWATPPAMAPGGGLGNLQVNDGSGHFSGATGTAYSTSGDQLTVFSVATGNIPLVVKGISGQTGHLAEFRDSTGAVNSCVFATGAARFSGAFDENTVDIGVHIASQGAFGSPTPRILFCLPGFANWQVDVSSPAGNFRWFTPGIVQMSLDPSAGLSVTKAITSLVGFKPPHLADSAASNDTIFFSTTSSKLAYKDSAGTVTPLN